MKNDLRSQREFVSVSSFISPLAETLRKENTSNGEMRANVGHEQRGCLINAVVICLSSDSAYHIYRYCLFLSGKPKLIESLIIRISMFIQLYYTKKS